MYLITKWFGTFLYDKNDVKKYILFPKDKISIVKKLLIISQGKILPEEKKLSKKIDINIFEKRLQKIGNYIKDDYSFKNIIIKPEEYGYSFDLLKKASLIVTQKNANEKLISLDNLIIQMIKTLDDFIQISNLLRERLDSWSSFYKIDYRLNPLNNTYNTVNSEIIKLQNQIEADMHKVAPNISSVIGPLIGARLISYANGLQRLAQLPSSTIQILGAEKALFRSKKLGSLPPKHGIIFQHPYINKAAKSERGKCAKIFAAKISIAAKADAFTKRDLSKDLILELEQRMNEIRNL